MKIKIIILAVLLTVLVFWGCKSDKPIPLTGEENFSKDESYALGMTIGESLKNSFTADGITVDLNEFLQGFKDSLSGAETRFSSYEANLMIEMAFSVLTEQRNSEASQAETAFLAENSRKPGVIITSSGLQYEIITETDGQKPSIDSTVLVHYEGRLTDGTLFDSTYDYGEPINFPLYAVIPGWTEGLQLMSVGSKYIFYIPSELGYGTNGVGPIPPYSTLVFTVELLDILD